MWDVHPYDQKRAQDLCCDLYEGSYEKSRVFGGFVLLHLIELCGLAARRQSQWPYTRTNQYGGITTAQESNTHTMT